MVIDSGNAPALAEFYAALLGGEITKDDGDWVVVTDGQGRRWSFQTAPDYRPPVFPDPAGSQQMHLDVLIERAELDEATRRIEELGGRRLAEHGDDFQVFTDPAGHPFCLVWTD